MSNDGHVIEFVGIPGAGKSTIASRLQDELCEHDPGDANQRLPSSGWDRWVARLSFRMTLILTATRNVELFLRAARIVTRLRPLTGDHVKRVLSLLRFDQHERGAEYVIRDQGKIQAVWSAMMFAEEAPSQTELMALWRAYSQGRIHTIVYVECPEDEALRRLMARPGGLPRVAGLDEEQIRYILHEGTVTLLQLAQQCADVDGSRLVVLDGIIPPEQNVRLLLNTLGGRTPRCGRLRDFLGDV